jgi:hypothetical protein
MKGVMDYILSHQFAAMVMAFAALLIVYFLLKNLLKIALVIMLIAIAVGGYYYFKDPAKMPENIRQTILDTREKSGKVLEKGKQAYRKTKDLVEKGQVLSREAEELFKKKEEKPGKEP